MELRNKSVFVTGAAGFIGSHLVEKLLKFGNRVKAYDNFDDFYGGKEPNIKRCLENPNFELCKSDILDFEQLSKSMTDADVVFHLAAQPGVGFSVKNPWKTNTTNVTGTLNVLLAATKNKVRKVVFASSSSVYGMPRHLPCSEDEPTLPLSVYGASKLAGENYCLTFFRNLGLPVVILRYHTVYGPRQRPDMAIHKFTKAMLEGQSPIVYGDGEQTRDFTYISDAVDGTILAAEKKDDTGHVFNIGSGSSVTVNQVIVLLGKMLGKDDVLPIYQDRKPDDMPHTFADIRKARDMLGYSPKTSFEQGLENFVRWFRANPF